MALPLAVLKNVLTSGHDLAGPYYRSSGSSKNNKEKQVDKYAATSGCGKSGKVRRGLCSGRC